MRSRLTRRRVRGTAAQINPSSSTTTGDVQPPPSQLASVPFSLVDEDAVGDEDNTNSNTPPSQLASMPFSLVDEDADGDEDNTNSHPLPSQLASMPFSLGDAEGDEDNTNSHPPPSQLASMPFSMGDAEEDEDNTNSQAGGSNMRKKVRGKSSGKSILNAIEKNGGRKLQIIIPEHLARPVENASLLATGIGLIIRHDAPLINIRKYDDIPTQDKDRIYEGLKAWFEFIDIETDPSVKDKLDEMLKTAFRHWKSKMHKAYNKLKDAGQNPINNCPYDWFEEGVWEEMCRLFEEPKYKRRSDINKNNRSKLPYPHSSGSKPFHVRYYKMTEAERSLVKNWRDCHTRKNGRMVNDKAKLLFEEMDTKKRQRSEAGEGVEEEDILAETLGTKTGYRKGMGYGFVPPPPTKRADIHNNSEAMKKAREQLEEQQSQLENQQITIEQQKAKIEEQSLMIEEATSEIITLDAENDTLHSELTILKEKHMKLEAKMEKLLAAFARD